MVDTSQLTPQQQADYQRDLQNLEQARARWAKNPYQDPIGTRLPEEIAFEERWATGAGESSLAERMAYRQQAQHAEDISGQRTAQEQFGRTSRQEFEAKRQAQIQAGIITPSVSYYGIGTQQKVVGFSSGLSARLKDMFAPSATKTQEPSGFGVASIGKYTKPTFSQLIAGKLRVGAAGIGTFESQFYAPIEPTDKAPLIVTKAGWNFGVSIPLFPATMLRWGATGLAERISPTWKPQTFGQRLYYYSGTQKFVEPTYEFAKPFLIKSTTANELHFQRQEQVYNVAAAGFLIGGTALGLRENLKGAREFKAAEVEARKPILPETRFRASAIETAKIEVPFRANELATIRVPAEVYNVKIAGITKAGKTYIPSIAEIKTVRMNLPESLGMKTPIDLSTGKVTYKIGSKTVIKEIRMKGFNVGKYADWDINKVISLKKPKGINAMAVQLKATTPESSYFRVLGTSYKRVKPSMANILKARVRGQFKVTPLKIKEPSEAFRIFSGGSAAGKTSTITGTKGITETKPIFKTPPKVDVQQIFKPAEMQVFEAESKLKQTKFATATKSMQLSALKISLLTGAVSKTKTFQRTSVRLSPMQIQAPAAKTKGLLKLQPVSILKATTAQKLRLAQPQLLKQSQMQKTTTANVFPPPPIIPKPIVPFLPPSLNFGGYGGGFYKRMKISRKYAYTPSLSALVFNIRGKAPKKARYTGLETRPVTKGWMTALRGVL